MFKKRKRIILLCIIATLFAILTVWTVWGNKALELNAYVITSKHLAAEFDGFRIAQVSDFHNAEMGKDNKKLISILKESEPDIIVITGDMIDSRKTEIDVALSFASQAVDIAPCYYVTGNHEKRLSVSEYTKFKEGLMELGVTVLEDTKVKVELLGKTVSLVGVNDPSFNTNCSLVDEKSVISAKLDEIVDKEEFTVLLSHRPEIFDTYVEKGVDLVFSGHAHGGQFRIPFVGGVLAPNQGLFPKYDSGIYTEGNTTMVVSRGIGNSAFPFRLNNRPEVILVELETENT